MKFIKSEDQVADIFTKGLAESSFIKLRSLLGVKIVLPRNIS